MRSPGQVLGPSAVGCAWDIGREYATIESMSAIEKIDRPSETVAGDRRGLGTGSATAALICLSAESCSRIAPAGLAAARCDVCWAAAVFVGSERKGVVPPLLHGRRCVSLRSRNLFRGANIENPPRRRRSHRIARRRAAEERADALRRRATTK